MRPSRPRVKKIGQQNADSRLFSPTIIQPPSVEVKYFFQYSVKHHSNR